MIRKLLYFFAFIIPLLSNAQYYDVGQDPASVKWRQIKSDNFTIIYPVGFSKQAMHLANTLQYVREVGTKTLGHKPKHLTVILHNRTVVANAFSLWAPKRNEFFTCPPQNNYAQDWMEQLATHEYRHITQMDMLNKGFTKVLSWVLGQQVTVAVLGLFVPMWFMEGDAVATETLITKSGRGRIPSFEMKVRAQVLGDKMYSYDKSVLGSYKDYVPDQYNFGYQMVAGARKKYGPQIWESAMNYTAKYPFLVIPYNIGLKKVSGLSKVKLFEQIYSELDSCWKIQDAKTKLNTARSLTPDKQKIYTNYKFPHYVSDSVILAEKSGMDDIARFVQISGNKEKVIHTPGFYAYESLSITKTIDPGNNGEEKNSPNAYTTDNLSITKNFLVWAERKFDPRWSLRDYSVIVTRDIKTGKTRQITHKTRYFAPYLFPDAQKIAAVEVDENNNCAMVILDSKKGDVIKKFKAPENTQYLTPSVSDDGRHIVAVRFNEQGKTIVFVSPYDGSEKVMLKPAYDEITNPILYKNYLFFNGVYSGIDNVFAMDTLTGKVFQVTSARFGAGDIDISPNGKKMVYASYTPDGYQILESDFDPASWLPIEEVKDFSVQLYKSIIGQESGLVDSVNIPNNIYPDKPYHKWQHLFNPHSWAPVSINSSNISFQPGVSVMTQNMLSTMIGTLGYEYQYNDKIGKYYANLSYRAWYPVFDVAYSYGEDVYYDKINEDLTNKYTWKTSDLKLQASLPLTFTIGHYIQFIDPAIAVRNLNTFDVPVIPNTTVIDHYQAMTYSFSAFNQVKSVERDMRPRWGQDFSFQYKHTPFSGTDFGSVMKLQGSLLFPGIGRHHSLMLTGGMQKKTDGDLSFSDILQYPRGYHDQENNDITLLSASYKLPLLYPDLKIGSLFYFKRLKADFFYDYAKGTNPGVVTEYNSTGVELTTDMNVFRFLFPVDVGVRACYLPTEQKQVYEFLIGMNFTGF